MPRLIVVSIVVSLVVTGCMQFSTAPTGQGTQTFCEWVRDLVKSNSMPLETAARYYPQCAPFGDE